MIWFWSSQLAQHLTDFMGGPVQTLEGVGGLSILALAYRHLNCHQHKCWRLGRFPWGHLRLCHRHHPLVPDDGQITAEHITAVSKTLSG